MADDINLPSDLDELRRRYVRLADLAPDASETIRSPRIPRTEDQRSRHRAATADYKHGAQDATRTKANRRHQRWTRDEDQYILLSDETIRDKALSLNRTFYSVLHRQGYLVRLLRENKVPEYDSIFTTRSSDSSKSAKTQPHCQCATIDTVHEDWCSQYKE